MTIEARSAPHIHHRRNTRMVMLDVVLVLLILYAMAVFFYGPRALVLGAWSVAVSVFCDIVCILVARRRLNRRDWSAVVTGLILPLMMPASVSYTVVTVAAVVAIVVAKHPFGGVGHNVFNPAAAGFSFAAISYGSALFTYPLPGQWLPVFGELEVVTATSPAFSLSLGGVPSSSVADMLLLEKYPGPMGATYSLVIIACLLYLILRNTVRWDLQVSFFATVSLFAFLFPRANTGHFESVGYELMSGLLLFGGVFLLGDPVTTPKRDLSKVGFGIVAGIVVMLFRYFSTLEEGFTFAILLMNATVWTFDMLGERVYSRIRRRRVETFNGKKIQKKA